MQPASTPGTLPVSIDESHIERACGVIAIDAACIDAEMLVCLDR